MSYITCPRKTFTVKKCLFWRDVFITKLYTNRVFLLLNIILFDCTNSLQIFSIFLIPLILGHIIVMSSAYESAPIYTLLIWHPIWDLFNVNNNGSIYKVKKIGEITPPCFTPFETLKYSNLYSHQITQDK